MRHCFRKISHGLITSVEEPSVDAGALAGERNQHRGGDHLPRLATGEKVDRPRGVARIRRGKIALQRGNLCVS